VHCFVALGFAGLSWTILGCSSPDVGANQTTHAVSPSDLVAGDSAGDAAAVVMGPSPALEPAPKKTSDHQTLDDAQKSVSPAVGVRADNGKSEASSAEPRDRLADGRPVWWIDGAARRDGKVTVAAEALGADLRSARRAAVDAGISKLAKEIGAEPSDWVVMATMIRPLRAVRGPKGVNHFVGYVLISSAP